MNINNLSLNITNFSNLTAPAPAPSTPIAPVANMIINTQHTCTDTDVDRPSEGDVEEGDEALGSATVRDLTDIARRALGGDAGEGSDF